MQICLTMFSPSSPSGHLPFILLSLVYVLVSASLSSSTTVTIRALSLLLPFCLSLTVSQSFLLSLI